MEAVEKVNSYQTSYLPLSKLYRIFSVLKSMKLAEIKGRVSCSSQSVIELLNRDLTSLQRPMRSQTDERMLGKNDLPREQSRKLKYKRTIDFTNRVITKVFVNEYKNQLNSFGTEFRLYMQWEGAFIKVYSDVPISTIFESQILDMKHQLKWLTVRDSLLYRKLKYSKYIRQELEQMHIKFIYLSRQRSVVLHSSIANDEDLRNARSKFSSQAIILQYYAQCYSPLVNKMYFKALMYHCEPFLNQISNNHEIKIEICWKMMGVVLHTPVPIFAQEPKQLLTNFLSNILFVAYFTPKPSQHLFHISSHQPHSRCVRTIASREIIYTSWDVSKEITPKEVTEVFQLFYQELNINTKVRIGFRTGGLNSNLIQKVEDLAEKHKLYTDYPEFIDEKQQLQIKFKSFLNHSQKRNQINLFLQELLTGKTEAAEMKPQKTSASQEQVTKNKKCQIVLMPTQLPKIENKTEDCFEYAYQMPELVEAEQFGTKKGQRNRGLEDFIFDKYGIVGKIWNLKIFLPKEGLANLPSGLQCCVYAVQSFQILRGFEIQSINAVAFQKVKPGRQYYLISRVECSRGQNLMTHIMSVYQI